MLPTPLPQINVINNLLPPQTPTENMRELANRPQANPQGEPQHNSPTRHQMGQGSANQRMNRTPDRTTQGLRNKKGLRKRANIKIGTININGLHTATDNNHAFEKWSEINATMRDKKIAILAVQETHLDEQNTEAIHKALGKRIVIINSQLENNPRTSAGVAFVLNKDLINTEKVEKYELIKGKVIAIKLTWKTDEEIVLINVYAPNRRSDHKSFWETAENERVRKRLRKPDFVLGDFNVTEEPIDRIPAKHDTQGAVTALREYRLSTSVQDQWRHAFPKAREYTYRTTVNGQQRKSRLDRIYVLQDKTKYTFDWNTAPSSIPTDHWLVSVKYAPKDSPYIGKGRWTWPLNILRDKKIMKQIEERGLELQEEIKHLLATPNERSDTKNPQVMWKTFKTDITKRVANEAKIKNYKCQTKLRSLKKDRKETIANLDFEENSELQWQESLLASEIEHLEKVLSQNNRERLKAKITWHGEKLGGTWSNLSKPKKPRDTIPRLRVPNSAPHNYETRSDKMAELAKHYHDSLQNAGLEEYSSNRIKQNMTRILEEIPEEQKFRNPEISTLNEGITRDVVEEALRLAKNGSATGLDGCPYELWKELNKRYKEAEEEGKTGFDIIKTLALIFQDIQYHGIAPNTNFAEGWMCPLFKKKDRTLIENYRPITLLNSDYKLLTKALTLQLIDDIKRMIH